jgi:uncharacterized protein (TIGR02145 family)
MRNLLSFVCFFSLINLSFNAQTGSITDKRDGKTYRTVKIGNQTWMAENLNVTTFRNGDQIPEAKTNEEWRKAGEEGKPAWCYFENNEKNGQKSGKLYNWYAIIDSRNICPLDWRVPTVIDFEVLVKQYDINFTLKKEFATSNTAATFLKSKSGWYNDNGVNNYNGTNESGFTFLPGGRRTKYSFDNTNYGYLWTSDEHFYTNVRTGIKESMQAFTISFEEKKIIKEYNDKLSGYSLRCIFDTPAEMNNSTTSVVTSTNSTSNQESITKTIVYSNSVYWGGVVNNKCEGNGVIQFNNGDLYEGNFLNDLKNGFGVFYFSNGDRYEGNWVDDKRSGQGTYFFNNGDRFVGQFIDGKKTDNGTYSYGVDKKGCISGDCQNGTGKKVFTNGVYEGQFKNGKFHGKGKYNYPNKSTYDGDWQDGVKQGKGQYVWYNGDFYIGDFQNDKKQGYGVYYWGKGNSDGAKYSGGWYEGEKTGWGVFTSKNGTIQEGNFEKGIYKGKEIQRMVDAESKPTTTVTTGASNYSEKEIVDIYEKFMKDLNDGKYNQQLLTMSLNYLDTAKIDPSKSNKTSTSSSSNSNPQTKKTNKCSSCNGTGKHSECNQKRRTSHYTETCSIEREERVNSGYVLCSECYGWGVKGSCPGTTCYYCKGSAWMACKSNSCDRGACKSCKGTGQN